jgi:uncharacterized protein (DUF1800 family)
MLRGLAAVAAERPLVDEAADRALWEEVRDVRDARGDARSGGMAAEAAFESERKDLRRKLEEIQFATLARAAETPHGFAERMARFWANHFTVAVKFPGHWSRVAGYPDQAIRPHVAGRFEDMLIAVVRHPAMLMYLDQDRSYGPNSRAGKRRGRGLNENLAREVLELHTLGAGGPYGQADVQALAALLTGFAVGKGRFRYRDAMAEPGRFELLGTRYRGAEEAETLDALRALARHPATARHVSRKLAVHFVADAPPEALVEALAARWRETEGDLSAVSAALLAHPAAWGPLGGKVRPPQEALIAALRADGATGGEIGPGGAFGRRLTLGALADMGQAFHRAPGPDGWPEAAGHWITPGGMAARLQWAARMGRVLADRVDPRAYAAAALGEALSPETERAVSWAAERWEGHALLLVSPDFNRR